MDLRVIRKKIDGGKNISNFLCVHVGISDSVGDVLETNPQWLEDVEKMDGDQPFKLGEIKGAVVSTKEIGGSIAIKLAATPTAWVWLHPDVRLRPRHGSVVTVPHMRRSRDGEPDDMAVCTSRLDVESPTDEEVLYSLWGPNSDIDTQSLSELR